MQLYLAKNTVTLNYAAEELAKYLKVMDGTESVITVGNGTDGIRLGLLSDLSLSEEGLEDPMIDDIVDVKVVNRVGYIAGSNERSVLMGVYALLKSLGCKWVRPGKFGEYIPKVDTSALSLTYRKKADHSFRGECIEGAVSYEHVRDTVYWLPKVNMNFFMMEQIVPYNYMSRWYKHNVSTVKGDEGVSFEEVSEMVVALEKDIKKCGLQLHALGHGYLLEPYGIHYKTGGDHYELSEEGRREVALVNGKRELFLGSPNFTHLCYSNDKARLGLVNWLVSYLGKKPYIDFLHVWLADATGNQCECENCVKTHPSDYYVMLLNELDAALTEKGIDTKIVFIMYVDTMWPPEFEKLINKNRFIMTTTTARSYNFTYSPERSADPIPKWERNNYSMKGGLPMTLKLRDAWKPAFDGKCFAFEYYMYTDHYFDPGYMSISRNILKDIKNLSTVEFDGILSDMTQRSSFPTGLPMSVFGEGLFDKKLDFKSFAEGYFRAAYGEEGDAVMEYLDGITDIFDPASLRVNDSIVLQDTGTGGESIVRGSIKNNPETAKRLERVKPFVDAFAPVVERNCDSVDDCHRYSWQLLRYHGEYCKRLAEIYVALALNGEACAAEKLNEAIDYLSRVEDDIHPDFDLVLFAQRVNQVIKG